MPSLAEWLNQPAFRAFGALVTVAEIAGFVTGALCVWLLARQNIWNWPIAMANNILFLYLFQRAGLYADAALQVVFFSLSAYGWYHWLRPGRRRDELPVSIATGRTWAILLPMTLGGAALLFAILRSQTDSTVPAYDALTTALSLAAIWGQTRKILESWYLWILADLIYIPLYAYKALWLTAMLYVIFLALCINGLVSWRRALREQI
jgi:nicotinamide mononucleotide transporter